MNVTRTPDSRYHCEFIYRQSLGVHLHRMSDRRRVCAFIRDTEMKHRGTVTNLLFHKYTATTMNFLHPISCKGVPSYDLC